jgi:hypothetical protein
MAGQYHVNRATHPVRRVQSENPGYGQNEPLSCEIRLSFFLLTSFHRTESARIRARLIPGAKIPEGCGDRLPAGRCELKVDGPHGASSPPPRKITVSPASRRG